MMVADFKIQDCFVIPQEALLPNYRGCFLEQHKSGERKHLNANLLTPLPRAFSLRVLLAR